MALTLFAQSPCSPAPGRHEAFPSAAQAHAGSDSSAYHYPWPRPGPPALLHQHSSPGLAPWPGPPALLPWPGWGWAVGLEQPSPGDEAPTAPRFLQEPPGPTCQLVGTLGRHLRPFPISRKQTCLDKAMGKAELGPESWQPPQDTDKGDSTEDVGELEPSPPAELVQNESMLRLSMAGPFLTKMLGPATPQGSACRALEQVCVWAPLPSPYSRAGHIQRWAGVGATWPAATAEPHSHQDGWVSPGNKGPLVSYPQDTQDVWHMGMPACPRAPGGKQQVSVSSQGGLALLCFSHTCDTVLAYKGCALRWGWGPHWQPCAAPPVGTAPPPKATQGHL